jgi:hypothetical protein
MRRASPAMVALACLVFPPAAWAQTAEADWDHGTTLAGFAGVASPFSGVDPALGLSLGWEVTPRFGVEGRGTWFPTSDGVSAFAASIGARVGIQSARPILPFVSGGVGLYRTTFETPLREGIPRFFERRMRSGEFGRTFDDFLVTFGGGVEVFVSRHLALRPEFTMLLATTRADVHAVPQFGVQLAYHFESHPITP